MKRSVMQQVMYTVFNECDALRQAGQAEYAHNDQEAFANFNRVAEALQLDRKQVLLVYALKHWDGIASFVAGQVSQREDVRGRIDDLIVYLCLLRGMIDEEQGMIPPDLQAHPMQMVSHPVREGGPMISHPINQVQPRPMATQPEQGTLQQHRPMPAAEDQPYVNTDLQRHD